MTSLRNLLSAAPAVLVMLVLQIMVLTISLDTYGEVSIFCTGPADGGLLQWTFALLHLLFLVFLAVGIFSLKFRRVRPFYLIILVISLAALPVQAKLVHAGALKCDVP